MTRSGRVDLPDGVSWRHVTGIAFMAGIGFTMALFIAGLAFSEGGDRFDQAKLGIFAASVVAAVAGYALLRWAAPAEAGEP